MKTHNNSIRQHGTFYFNDSKVIAYGLMNGGGGETTVFNFLNKNDAKEYAERFLTQAKFPHYINKAQVVCLANYSDAFHNGVTGDNSIKMLTYAEGDM